MIAWLGGLIACLGAALVLVGGVGLLRLPDLYSRLHAAGVTETLGATAVIVGLMLHAGFDQALIKLAFVGAFLLATGPVATHAIARAAQHGGLRPAVGREPAPAQSESAAESAAEVPVGGKPTDSTLTSDSQEVGTSSDC